MFEKHFHLTENPFSLTPDPRFIFGSRSHDEALATLRYWVEHREGFVMVTGEVGTGKTTSLFRLIDNLEQRFEIAFLTNSTLTPVELLEEICRKFKMDGLSSGMSKSALLQRLESYLLKLRDLRHAAILIIDEAQNFDHELLEEVRLLSNTAVPSGPPLLQIALVGQPELERKLGSENLRQLRQRIGVHYRIEPLTEDETVRYIRHRIGVAGGNPDVVFPVDAAHQLFRYTNGLPREINQVASQAMLHAYVEGAPGVRPDHVKSAAWEMQFRSVLDRSDGSTPAEGPASGATMGVVTGGAGSPRPSAQVPSPLPIPPPPPVVVVAPPAVAPLAPTPSVPAAPPAPQPLETAPSAGPTIVIPPTGGGGAPATRLKTVIPAAPAAPLGRLPGTGSAEAGPPPKQGGFLKRAGLVFGIVAILAAAAALMLWPRPKPNAGDDVSDAQNERTMPTDSLDVLQRSMSAGLAPSPAVGDTTVPSTGGAPISAALDSAARHAAALNPPVGGAAARETTSAGVTPPPATPPVVTPPAAVPTGDAPSPATPPASAAATTVEGRLPGNAWRLQVASFRDSSLAESEGRRVAQKLGWQYEVVRGRLRGEGAIFAVFLGPFETKADADSALVRMSGIKTGMKDALVKGPRTRR